MAIDAPGMKGNRSRNQTGPLRGKNGNTEMGEVEKTYGKDFGVRSDMHLSTFLKREGVDSLSKFMKK